MKIKLFIAGAVLSCSLMFTSCFDMDIPPMNIIPQDELFSSENGMNVYLARIYSQMPFEEFRYSPRRQFFDFWLVTPGTQEGSSIGRDAGAAMTREGDGGNDEYWGRAFELLRDVNILLESFPNFKDNFSEQMYNHYIGEAYFARAYVFYAFAKRYGGAPLVLEVLKYPEFTADELEVPRSSEEETWDQILSDFNTAIQNLSETSPKRGYANKNVARAFKSEAMLFAACVAKYNKLTGFGEKTNVRVIGFDPGTAQAASRKYFLEAYNAARDVMKSGRYSLYLKKWSATDRDGQYQNMVDMFSDLTSTENIYIHEYLYPTKSHGYDAYNVPRQFMGPNGYSAGNNPTLDFVELFDGIEKNPDGTIKVFDDKGKYILFDNPMDIFRNAEPRLRANVILPGDIFKGEVVDIRRGFYTGEVTNGISPLMTINGVTDYTRATMSQRYTAVDAFTGRGEFSSKVLYLGVTPTNNPVETDASTGIRMASSGINGPFTDDNTCALLGFSVRKWLNPNLSQALTTESHPDQHFVLMRYGEILLNVAEAACELALAGVAGPGGDDLTQIAHDAIAAIRSRAGADPLVGTLTLNEEGLLLIRKERRKELAFENKILWDIRRWRTQHSDPLNGSTQAEGARYRGLYPFYSSKAQKWFFDARIDERLQRTYTLREHEYHFAIPNNQVSRSSVIDQNPFR